MHSDKLKIVICSGRFKENIFERGEIGGYCKFDEALHRQQGEHKSALQSWYAKWKMINRPK